MPLGPPGSGACLKHADVTYTGFLEKDDISASSATSGHPRRESACCLPLALRCCWLRNRKRSFEVISELHLKCRTAVPEKAEKVYSFDGGREWVCLCVLPHLRREFTRSWSNVAVVLHHWLHAWSRLFQSVSKGVLFNCSVD